MISAVIYDSIREMELDLESQSPFGLFNDFGAVAVAVGKWAVAHQSQSPFGLFNDFGSIRTLRLFSRVRRSLNRLSACSMISATLKASVVAACT